MMKMICLYTFEDGHQETHIFDNANERFCENAKHRFESNKVKDHLLDMQAKDNIVQVEIVSKEEY